MPLELYRPTTEDALALAGIQWDSYESEAIVKTIFDPPAPPHVRQWLADSFLHGWPKRERFAAKDTSTNEIVSHISYEFVPASQGESWKRKPKEGAPEAPKDMNLAMLERFGVVNWQQRVDVMGPQPFIHLQSLSTLPVHQRRGAGRMLLEVVIAEGEKRNLPIFLTATPKGRPLYLRNGFKEKSVFELDLSSINEPPRKNWSMVRPAPRPGQPVDFPASAPLRVQIMPIEHNAAALKESFECANQAFEGDPLFDLCFGGTAPQRIDERVEKDMPNMEKEEFIYRKAVDPKDPDGPALGFAKWVIVKDPFNAPSLFDDQWPEGTNVECCEAMFGALKRSRNNYFQERNQPYVYMRSLMVLPHAQRRGVGSALLLEGLKEVDSMGLDTFIDASPAGVGLYSKFGWEEVDRVTINLKDYGGEDHPEISVALVRKAGAHELK